MTTQEAIQKALAMIPGAFCKECEYWVLGEAGRDCYICINDGCPCYLEDTRPTFGCVLGRRG